jgi:hypothetical protein
MRLRTGTVALLMLGKTRFYSPPGMVLSSLLACCAAFCGRFFELRGMTVLQQNCLIAQA